MDKAPERKGWLDQAKGIGILLVVLGHMDQGNHPLYKWISSFHMPLFFILSGIVVAMRNGYAQRPLKDVLLKKARQLFYPYLTFSLLVIVYFLLRGKADIAFRAAWLTAALEGYNALWFLPSLWMAECMMLVLLRSRIPPAVGTAVIVLGTSAYSALQYYAIGGAMPAEEGAIFLILNGLCRAGIGFVFMMAGYGGYRLCIGLKKLSRRHWVLLSSTSFVLGFALCWLNSIPDLHYSVQGNPLLYYASSLLQSAGVIAWCVLTSRSRRILEFFGKNSLIIMATHFPLPLINLAQWMLGRMGTGLRYLDDLLGCTMVMLIESVIILAINRHLPFLLRPPKKKSAECNMN